MLICADELGLVGGAVGVHVSLQLPVMEIGIRPLDAEIQLKVFFKN